MLHFVHSWASLYQDGKQLKSTHCIYLVVMKNDILNYLKQVYLKIKYVYYNKTLNISSYYLYIPCSVLMIVL